jgi:hypothetical protein
MKAPSSVAVCILIFPLRDRARAHATTICEINNLITATNVIHMTAWISEYEYLVSTAAAESRVEEKR